MPTPETQGIVNTDDAPEDTYAVLSSAWILLGCRRGFDRASDAEWVQQQCPFSRQCYDGESVKSWSAANWELVLIRPDAFGCDRHYHLLAKLEWPCRPTSGMARNFGATALAREVTSSAQTPCELAFSPFT
jgi:hypothetical protein